MHEPVWQRLDVRPAYTGRVVVRDHRVRLPDGSTTRYEVEESIPFAVAVLVQVSPGMVLVTRQYRYPVDRWIYDLPGGAGTVGETPEQAARRECEEETGRAPGDLTHLHTFFSNPGRTAWPTHLYLAHGTAPGVADTSDPSESVGSVELTVGELDELVSTGQVVDPGLFIAWTVARSRGDVVPAR